MPVPADAADRLCRVRTENPSDEVPFALDSDGFLAPRHQFSWETAEPSDGALITVAAAAQSGALVLLGEPGVGKTTALRALTERLPLADEATEAEHGLLWLDGTDLTDYTADRLLCRHLERLPSVAEPGLLRAQPGRVLQTARLTIVLDQLDESAYRLGIASRIREALKGRDTSGLRWLVACRAVDYPAQLTRQLEADGRTAVVADLAPLSREQAVRLADESGVDGEALIAATVEAGAGALASIPLTLRLLAELRRCGTLASTARELFDRSVRQLLSEPADGRRGINVAVDQLFVVAARIAARVILSGRRTIWIGRELVREAGRGEIDVRAGTLPGGEEHTASGPFPLTAELVDASLKTAVFAPRGADRLAFSHSSIAAYLAACHLTSAQVPESQLKSLFLVTTGDGSTSIPSPLRETAAWLITLQPAHAAWLTEADPRSLASYSSLVDNAETRRALVTAMLRRAGELELSDLPWQLDRTRLSYPNLAEQLAQVLVAAASVPESWPDRARARLAVRIAHQARVTSDLTESLLAIAESPHWDPHERRLAIGALGDLDPTAANVRLRRILDTELADPSRRAQLDPDDEIRGGVLLALWPDQLTLTEALTYVSPNSNRNMSGPHAIFLRELPVRLGDDDIPLLLRWTARSIHGPSDAAVVRWADAGKGASKEIIPMPIPSNDPTPWAFAEELIEPLLDRATSWEHGDRFMGHVAELVWPALQADEVVALPDPLAVTGPGDLEATAAHRARRALLLALCQRAKAVDKPSLIAGRIVYGWKHRFRASSWRLDATGEFQYSSRATLVEPRDFAWILSEAAAALTAGDQELAALLAQVGSDIMDPDDWAAHEVAFSYEHTPLWTALRWHFDPVPLDGDRAKVLRRRYERNLINPEPRSRFPEAEEFRTKILEDWNKAVEGDTTAFWQLLWNLQFEPETGKGYAPSTVDDPRCLPAAVLGEPSLIDLLPDAASNFANKTNDRRAEWLGTRPYDERAWAGYLAIALLERLGRTTELGEHVWKAWVGAILSFRPGAEPDDGRARRCRLLEMASQHAYDELDEAITTYVIGAVDQGSTPNDINLHNPRFVSRHQRALFQAMDTIGTAMRSLTGTGGTEASSGPSPDPSPGRATRTLLLSDDPDHRNAASRTLSMIMRALLAAGHPTTITVTMTAIHDAPTEGPATFEVICADLLLRTGAVKLSAVLDALQPNSQLGAQLANHVGSRSGAINSRLDEEELAQLLVWLQSLPSTAPDLRRLRWDARDGIWEWRRQTLSDLAGRQTTAALDQLNALQAQFPDQLDIAAAVLTVRTAVHANLWKPPDPDDVALLLNDARRRLVRTNHELADLLVETLDQIAQDLPAHGELLWDRQRQHPRVEPSSQSARSKRDIGTWRPKPEAAFCAYVTHELRTRLQLHGIAINREVLVTPTDPYGAGDRTDILVEAFARMKSGSGSADDNLARLAVVIEAKGQWNLGLEDDLTGQLAGRYLPAVHTDSGIYLVGWFPIDHWDDTSDAKRQKARRRAIDPTRALLEQRAAHIDGKRVVVRIIEVPRPRQKPASEAGVIPRR
ncbi:NACHT domain-containing protein [Actinoplanes sp. CA-054009]